MKLGGWFSCWKTLNGEVTQGTVLGPVLFFATRNNLLNEWPDRWKYVYDSMVTDSVMMDSDSNLKDLVNNI